jgi:sorting nexin-8
MAQLFEDPWGVPSHDTARAGTAGAAGAGAGASPTTTPTTRTDSTTRSVVDLPVHHHHDDDTEDNNDLLSYVHALRTQFNPLAKDIVEITQLPEREGVLLFKYTNYLVQHLVDLPDSEQSTDRKVVRRYSDFDWLHQVLLAKYPFRLIPELPPKRITGTTDQEFLKRRLNGLVRFINQIMKHPVLSQEQLVLMFLTVPTDLSSWRKHASYDTSEEFANTKKLPSPHAFIELWHSNVEQFNDLLQVDKINLQIVNALDNWNKLTVLIERFAKRYQQIASDDFKFNKILNNFNDSNNLTLFDSFHDGPTINEISEGLKLVSLKFQQNGDALNEVNELVHATTLEKFKNFNDYLISFKLLVDRFEAKGGNQIPLVQSRIQLHQSKLNELNKKPDVKGFEVDKLNDLIKNDQNTIEIQTNRDWLIKQSLINELIIFQGCQFQITSTFHDLVANLLKLNELQSNNWSTLLDSIQDMPLSRQN